jgi:hypothetical protein
MMKASDGAKPKIGLWLGPVLVTGPGPRRVVVRFSLFCSALFLAAFAVTAPVFADQPKLVLGKYEAALKLMDQGQCDKARETLFPNGKMAAGDEVAISDIGDCYLHAAAKEKDADAAQRMRETGAGWVLRAAEFGIAEAQATAVKLYLDDKIFFTDPYEAVKWYLLWQNNRSQMQLGKVEFDPVLSKQLSAYNADVWAEGKARALAWKAKATLRFGQESDAP